MNALAIIPARGGSKRIPRKNIRPFLGKPIAAYSIQTALSCNLFTQVMVSTDDDQIARIAKEYGASVPFLRSRETANDYAGIAEGFDRGDRRLRGTRAAASDTVCCLFPTAPLITESDLAGRPRQAQRGGDSIR